MWWPFSKKKNPKKTTHSVAKVSPSQAKSTETVSEIKSNFERNFFKEDTEFDSLIDSDFSGSIWGEKVRWPSEEEFSDITELCKDDFPEPNNSFEVFKAIHNPDASVKEIADAVTKDPALVAVMLKEVNSARYGFHHEINEVTRAIVLLGYNEVKSIVLQNSLSKVFSQDEDDLKRLRHCRIVSLIAFHLASNYPECNPNEISTLSPISDTTSNPMD